MVRTFGIVVENFKDRLPSPVLWMRLRFHRDLSYRKRREGQETRKNYPERGDKELPLKGSGPAIDEAVIAGYRNYWIGKDMDRKAAWVFGIL